MKSIKKHNIKINGIYDVSDIKTKKIFYNEPYEMRYSVTGSYFSGSKVDFNIYDNDEVSIYGGNFTSNSHISTLNVPYNEFTGSNNIIYTGYNEWNKEAVEVKYPITLVERKLNIINKDDIDGKTFYSIEYNGSIVNFKLMRLSEYSQSNNNFWIEKSNSGILFGYKGIKKDNALYYVDMSEEWGVVNKKLYDGSTVKSSNFSEVSVKFNLDKKNYTGTYAIYCIAYPYFNKNNDAIQIYDNTKDFTINLISLF